METKVTRNIQPNNKSPFSWLSKILKGIKTGLGAVGGVLLVFSPQITESSFHSK